MGVNLNPTVSRHGLKRWVMTNLSNIKPVKMFDSLEECYEYLSNSNLEIGETVEFYIREERPFSVTYEIRANNND